MVVVGLEDTALSSTDVVVVVVGQDTVGLGDVQVHERHYTDASSGNYLLPTVVFWLRLEGLIVFFFLLHFNTSKHVYFNFNNFFLLL